MKALSYAVIVLETCLVAPVTILILGLHLIAVAPGAGAPPEWTMTQLGIAVSLVILTLLLAGGAVQAGWTKSVLIAVGTIFVGLLPIMELIPATVRLLQGVLWVVAVRIAISRHPTDPCRPGRSGSTL